MKCESDIPISRLYKIFSRYGLVQFLLILQFLSVDTFAQSFNEQDCPGAIAVCQDTFIQLNSFTGEGLIPNEINQANSCLGFGELNDVWYTFSVQNAGQLCFTITPNNPSDDYDWAVFNLTNSSCEDIFSTDTLEVSCNYTLIPGLTGANGLAGSTNEPCIAVDEGERYVLNISNHSSTQFGYVLDFAASTAVIYDTIAPAMDSILTTSGCVGNFIRLRFTENILCGSVQPEDFVLTGPGGPYSVTAFNSAGCSSGDSWDDVYELSVFPTLNNGTFKLKLVGDSSFVDDVCGNTARTDSLIFTVTNSVNAEAGPNRLSCEGVAVTIGGTPTASGGSGSYSFAWVNNSTGASVGGSANVSVVPTDTTTFTVLITDSDGCTDMDSVKVNVIPSPIVDILPSTNELICSDDSLEIIAIITGGTPPYSIPFWSGSIGPLTDANNDTTYFYTQLSGVYNINFDVNDNNGCVGHSAIAITVNPTPNMIVDTLFLTCQSESLIVDPNFVIPGGTYSWTGDTANVSETDDPSTTFFSDTVGTFSLGFGVSSPDGCSAFSDIVVQVGPGITTDTSGVLVTQPNCGNNDGSIVFTNPIVSGGTSPFLFSWRRNGSFFSSSVTDPNLSSIASGNYSLSISDQFGCQDLYNFNVSDNNGPQIDTLSMTIFSDICDQGLGSITDIQISGGSGPGTYTCTWFNGTSIEQVSPSPDVSGLGPSADYNLTVSDQNNCTIIIGPIEVNNLKGIAFDSANHVINPDECGAGNGSVVDIDTLDGGNGPISYTWFSSGSVVSNNLDLLNVTSGFYLLTGIDTAGCADTTGPYFVPDTGSAVINTSSVVTTSAFCNSSTGAVIGLFATGTGPFSYEWQNAFGTVVSTDSNLINVIAGSYFLEATDQFGCNSAAGPFVIASTNGLSVDTTNVVITNESCGSATGSVSGISASGFNPFTYRWENQDGTLMDTTLVLDSMQNGNYFLTVTDNLGCTQSSGPYVIDSSGMPIIGTTFMNITSDSCGQSIGSVTGINVSGSGNYSFTWTNGLSTLGSDIELFNVPSGNYSLIVSDGACIDTLTPVVIPALDNINVDLTALNITHITCGLTVGSVQGIVVSNGQFTYTWTDGSGIVAFSTVTPDLIGQPQGTYLLEAVDTSGCSRFIGPFTILQEEAINIDTTAILVMPDGCGQGTGSILGISINGGSGTLTYDWDNGTTIISSSTSGADITGLDSGNYNLTVFDTAGCVITFGPVFIGTGTGSLTINTALTVPDTCQNSLGAINNLDATGTGTFVLWTLTDIFGSIIDTTTGELFTGLSSGTYHLLAQDSSGCMDTLPNLIVGNVATFTLDTLLAVIAPDTCSNSLGSISGIALTGALAPEYFIWTNSIGDTVGIGSANIDSLATGSYFLEAGDATGCSVLEGPFFVPNFSPLGIDTAGLVVITTATCGQSNGSISGIQVVGASGPVSVVWTNGTDTVSNILDVSGQQGGVFNLELIDSLGCSSTFNGFQIPFEGGLQASTQWFVLASDTCNLGLGGITIDSSFADTGVTYTLMQGIDTIGTFGDTLNAFNLDSGDYEVHIVSAAGCDTTISVNIMGSEDITIGIEADPIIGEPPLFVQFSNNGTSNGTMLWNFGDDTTHVVNVIPQHTYNDTGVFMATLIITEPGGCSVSDSLLITVFISNELIIPNVFSPNFDGTNDVFGVFGGNIVYMHCVIYNRWGEKIYELNGPGEQWYGTTEAGVPVPAGTYFIILDAEDQDGNKFEVRSNITLLR